jgi:recombinational DNA repair ATPase RecF
MIRIDSIKIEEFRGIRHLSLDLNGRNFAVCGANGTGKSGVVDAVEFALTGNVSRLSGEGKGNITVRQHGPHVDRRNDPGRACVTVTATIPALNRTVTISRSPKNPTAAKVMPSEPKVLELLRKVEAHPEFVLSRRELIRYVLATPGERAQEVQALLHLDQVERVRVGLQKVANNCEKQLAPLNASVKTAEDSLLRALGVAEMSKSSVLAASNAQRTVLGLPPLVNLTEETSLKDGMATPQPAHPQRIPKPQALAEIRAARQTLAEIASDATAALAAGVVADLTALADDPAFAEGAARESLYQTGIRLVEAGACPLCDRAWDVADLKDHIQRKIERLKELSLQRKAAETRIAPLMATVRNVRAAIDSLVRFGELATPPIDMQAAGNFSAGCEKNVKVLTAFLPLSDTISALASISAVPPSVFSTVDQFETLVASLPEPSKQDAARDWLVVAQERLEVWRRSKRMRDVATAQAKQARQASDIYAETSDTVLGGIYAAVEKDFAALYRLVNRDDEGKFEAKLVPSMGKLGFDVDFYGRGFFPPGAYHSEGHQDGMGLCLYLALMRHLQGSDFTLAVLDDVLMSIDASHRREVCALLKKEFPHTQFIMTTHDPIWLRHMKTEGLIGAQSAVQFRSWDIDHGPTQWDERDVWREIDDHLKANDVRAAAGLLRHYLEYASAELCHRLCAQVGFRGDAQYQLGELLPSAVSRMRRLYANAKRAANSWNQKDVMAEIAVRESHFAVLAETSNAEQWQVNAAVHYNSWANLDRAEFSPVVTAFQDLLRGFTCPDCAGYLRVSPERGTPESVRCDCGKTTVNLRERT